MFCFYFVSAKLQTGGTIAPAKPLPSAFLQQNRHCLTVLGLGFASLRFSVKV